MKRKNLKPMIISALLAVGFGASSVGTSFALFTDRADTKIDVTAGIVDLAVKYENLKAYSLDETDNTKWVQVENGKFATDGTYTLNDQTGVVKLERMVPGDKVEFDIKLLNKSNVKTKYRFAMSKTGKLAPYLEASFGNEAKLQWTALEASTNLEDGKLVETAHVVIEFPNNTETSILPREEGYDNGAQGLSATYVLGYEMVQGNAQVTNDSVVDIEVEKSVNPVAPETPTGEYTFDIMSDDGLVGVAGIAENANPVKLTVTSDNTTAGNFTIEGATTANYDISVDGRKDDTDVTVKLYVGEGYQQVYVFHENETTPLDNVEYNSQTGYVTFVTDSFSQYHFAGVKEELAAMVNGVGCKTLDDAWKVSANKEIVLLKDVTADKMPTNNNIHRIIDNRIINLNNKKLTFTSYEAYENAGHGFVCIDGGLYGEGHLTLKNGTLNFENTSSKYGIYNYGSLTLQNLKVNSKATDYFIYTFGQSGQTAGPTLLDNIVLNSDGGGFYGSSFESSWLGNVVPTVTIKDSTLNTKKTSLYVWGSDNTIKSSSLNPVSGQAAVYFNGSKATSKVSFDGIVNLNGDSDYHKVQNKNNGSLVFRPGTYNYNPTGYVDTGLYEITDNGDGTWTVAEI